MSEKKKSICIIEDDPLVRRSLEYSLRDSGYEVMVAADGRSGISLAASASPDFVLTDFNMPHANGATVIKELREQAPDLAIIAMTGGGAGAALLLTAGADACLMKPFHRRELASVMSELDKSRR